MNLAILQLVQQEQSKQIGYQLDRMRLHMEPSISVLRPASLSHAYFQSYTCSSYRSKDGSPFPISLNIS